MNGLLTAAVIKRIARSGTFQYQNCGGTLLLKIKLLDLRDENIGFRYDRKKKGELKKTIIPTETRVTAIAEIALETGTGCVLLGPVRLSTFVEFDHDYYSSRNAVNIFSLGQVSDIDAAYDDVQDPLYYALAEKIVDFISESW